MFIVSTCIQHITLAELPHWIAIAHTMSAKFKAFSFLVNSAIPRFTEVNSPCICSGEVLDPASQVYGPITSRPWRICIHNPFTSWCCCSHHSAYHFRRIWAPHSIFPTQWAVTWWRKPWLSTLVDYLWVDYITVWLDHSDSTGKGGLLTDNRTGWRTIHCNKWLSKLESYGSHNIMLKHASYRCVIYIWV